MFRDKVSAERAKQNVAHFDAFYEENKDKILMDATSETYPIDTDALLEWSKALPANKIYLRMMAMIVTRSLQHVSFAEFYEILRLSAAEIAEEAALEGKKIVLVISGRATKSNLWVALLVWPLLREQVGDITKLVDWTTDAEYADLFREGVFYVHTDDASYSGQQLAGALRRNLPTLDRDTSRYYILTAAVSETAKKVIQDRVPEIRFASRALTFKEMYAHAIDLFPQPGQADYVFENVTQKPYTDLYQFFRQVHALYFDHKLPDGVSIIQKIIAVAPVLEDDARGTVTLRNLIKGCSVSDYAHEGKPMDSETVKEFTPDFDYDKTCPRAFYKTIPYTYKGVPLSQIQTKGLHILDYFKEKTRGGLVHACVQCSASNMGCSICKIPLCDSCFQQHRQNK